MIFSLAEQVTVTDLCDDIKEEAMLYEMESISESFNLKDHDQEVSIISHHIPSYRKNVFHMSGIRSGVESNMRQIDGY